MCRCRLPASMNKRKKKKSSVQTHERIVTLICIPNAAVPSTQCLPSTSTTTRSIHTSSLFLVLPRHSLLAPALPPVLPLEPPNHEDATVLQLFQPVCQGFYTFFFTTISTVLESRPRVKFLKSSTASKLQHSTSISSHPHKCIVSFIFLHTSTTQSCSPCCH